MSLNPLRTRVRRMLRNWILLYVDRCLLLNRDRWRGELMTRGGLYRLSDNFHLLNE